MAAKYSKKKDLNIKQSSVFDEDYQEIIRDKYEITLKEFFEMNHLTAIACTKPEEIKFVLNEFAQTGKKTSERDEFNDPKFVNFCLKRLKQYGIVLFYNTGSITNDIYMDKSDIVYRVEQVDFSVKTQKDVIVEKPRFVLNFSKLLKERENSREGK